MSSPMRRTEGYVWGWWWRRRMTIFWREAGVVACETLWREHQQVIEMGAAALQVARSETIARRLGLLSGAARLRAIAGLLAGELRPTFTTGPTGIVRREEAECSEE